MTKPERQLTIRDIYPHFSEEQLREAEENLERYIELAVRIYRRIKSDEDTYAQFKALTAPIEDHTIRIAKSNPAGTHKPPPPT